MTQEPDLWDRLCAFVRAQTSTRVPLSESTELFRDIGLDGDEADDFMGAFAQAFRVDSGDFDFARYFGAEGFNPLTVFKPAKKPSPLTLGMLLRAATLGEWRTEAVERTEM